MAFLQKQIARSFPMFKTRLSVKPSVTLITTVFLASAFVTPLPAATDAPPDQLVTRNFRLDPDALYALSHVARPADDRDAKILRDDSSPNLTGALHDMLAAAGVNMPNALTGLAGPNQKAMFVTSDGVVMIRATRAELVKIQSILATFNPPPPQVVIETKFVEVPYTTPLPPLLARSSNFTNIAILTEKQFRERLRRYEETAGVDVVTIPSIATISGRQARIQTESTRPVLYQTPPTLPKDTSPDADPTPHNKGRLPFPPTFRGRSA
jgi:hypothetical protein